jgi:alkaline phosphatase
MNRYFILIAVIFLGCHPGKKFISTKPPQNVILMIGDGMGLTQITAGLYRNGNKLHLERCKSIGLHKNYPEEKSGDLITDSAAGATAFSTGVKTYNAAIGMGPDTLPRTTILELANFSDMATGLIATSTITHATPASFIAHVSTRDKYEEIATWFLKNKFDLIIGGGAKHFSKRKSDTLDLMNRLKSKGVTVESYFDKELENIDFGTPNRLAYFTALDQPLPFSQGRNYLPMATEKGIEFLSSKKNPGFFLLVEGSQIDWGGHSNESEYIISEMIDFDNAVGKALDFAEKDKNTLVIITADHETGGYAIQKGSTMDSIKGKFTSDYHTGTMIPVFAFGPGSEDFQGIYENTDIFHKMLALLRKNKWFKSQK